MVMGEYRFALHLRCMLFVIETARKGDACLVLLCSSGATVGR